MAEAAAYLFFWLPEVAAVLGLLLAVTVILFFSARTRWRRERERFRADREAAGVERATLRTRLEERDRELAAQAGRINLLDRNLREAADARAALTAELAAAERARREQADLIRQADARLREAFGALSREALGQNNEMFLTLAKAHLGEFQKGAEAQLEAKRTAVDSLVKPIGETLTRMGSALEAAEKARVADHASFTAVQQTLAETTGRLVRALHHSAARGRWGEVQLRRVVEMAGMLEHCDFEEQVSVGTGERRLRPDLVIHLVGHRTIVVDAKIPMESYLRAQEAENEEAEREHRLRHAKAVKAHMADLGAKSYWSQFRDSPEFVVMFFPNEAVFADAMRLDPGIMEHGMANGVIPASPATLIALLKAADYGWQQQRASENAREIFTLGRELFDRFATEYKYLAAVGTSLGKAVEQYNRCVGSAERMLFPHLRRFGGLAEREFFPEPAPVEETLRTPTIPTTGIERTGGGDTP
ncbi:MAG: DNA recombination protein RmuC [Planctomycetes bacterium]|nr:DNA recombination protein RmuC [Planctomycetota bacterium]